MNITHNKRVSGSLRGGFGLNRSDSGFSGLYGLNHSDLAAHAKLYVKKVKRGRSEK